MARASATPTSVIAGGRVDLNGNLSRDNRTPLDELQFSWALESGPAIDIEQAQSAEAFFIAPNFDGTIRVGLSVTDEDGNNARDSVNIEVSTCDTTICTTDDQCDAGQACMTGCCRPVDPTTIAPVAQASADPASAVFGTLVQLDGTQSTDNATPFEQLQFSWTQEMGAPVTLSQSTGPTVAFVAPNFDGVLQFGLSVTDADGNSDDATVQVQVQSCGTNICNVLADCVYSQFCDEGCCAPIQGGPLAVATATPTAAFTNLRVALDARASRDDVTPFAQLQFEWRQLSTGAPNVTIIQPTSAVATFMTPQYDGNLAFEVTVTDQDNNTDTASVSIASTAVCIPLTDAQLCANAGQNCGPLSTTDNCNELRNIASCGECTRFAEETCGGSGVPNTCGCPPIDAELCTRIGANCDRALIPDDCNVDRVVDCGVCPKSLLCGGAGVANVCGGIEQIATGSAHTCVLISDGTVRCWGEGDNGRLGYNNELQIGDDETPDSVVAPSDIGDPARFVAAGFRHSCAIRASDGRLKCWGFNHRGQLGYGDPTRNIGDGDEVASLGSLDWVDPGDSLEVLQVAIGSDFTCVLLEGGSVKCFGEDADGQLGDGDGIIDDLSDEADEKLSLLPTVNVGGAVAEIGAGNRHVCVRLVAPRQVRCWGYGATGSLGYGNEETIGDNETPSTAGFVSLGEPVQQIAVGGGHTCALLDSGAVRCWGSNSSGQLGIGNALLDIGDNEIPTDIEPVALTGNVVEVSAGSAHTCVRFDDESIECWGANLQGRLGYGNTDAIATPSRTPVPVGDGVLQVDGGGSHTCAILLGGMVKCWGNHFNGQLGYAELYGQGSGAENIGDNELPSSVDPVPIIPR